MTYISDLDTPSLIIDIDRVKRNIEEMQQFADQQGIRLRPMIKTHKTPELALLQIETGAIGITCAKIQEAEIMVEKGIKDIFIAYEIVSEKKLRKLLTLSEKTRLMIAVDSVYGAEILNRIFHDNNKLIDVMIEIDTGLKRCGLSDLKEIYSLAHYIQGLPAVRFQGIFTHAGHVYGAKNEQQVEAIGKHEGDFLIKVKDYLQARGIALNRISTGSTPTSKISGKVIGVNEIRPGNYIFYDATQVSLGVVTAEQCALSVITTVISKPTVERAIIDAGSKTLALDKGAHGVSNVKGFGIIKEKPGVMIERLSEEHGILEIQDTTTDIKIGDRLEIIPNHSCTVVNLFDEAFLVYKDEIVKKIVIKGRGRTK